ncbi:ROK family protein [Streptomyces sp. NBC_00316]|uniref:ROK family protein n=1 Tax=Streptomyces sp. NBC_00316 TaxID=2975710 RepID=UPI003FA6DA5F
MSICEPPRRSTMPRGCSADYGRPSGSTSSPRCGGCSRSARHRLGAGFAGEIGHTSLPGHTEMCRCANRGCQETVMSARHRRRPRHSSRDR